LNELLGASPALDLCARLQSGTAKWAEEYCLIEPADALICLGVTNRQIENAIVLDAK
jgi:hypothetical protein